MVSPQIDPRLLGSISAEQAHRFHLIPLKEEEGKAVFLASPLAKSHLSVIELIIGKQVRLEIIPESEFLPLLFQSYPTETPSAGQLEKEQFAGSDIVRFVDKLFQAAIDMGASDIHLERYESMARIRFRWEGQLVERYEIALEEYNAIISRIKILAELDIAERRLPQDGRIHIQPGGKEVDIRVSSIPGKFGEKVVMRLLHRSLEGLNLHKLGFSQIELELYTAAIHKPNGMVLITGPTGSGKTTSLYATLSLLNESSKNITTIEDPIEYTLTGINQVQLKEEIGLNFDRALRAFLRQDPDIIMVGEIRDMATAQIAVRAALTGHLVFSTLHTNNAWDAISRLKDMGVAPYLLAAALRLIVAQRLVRILCSACKTSSRDLAAANFQEEFNIDEHFLPVGCPSCFYTGYRGRKGVFELLPIDKAMREAIKQEKSSAHQPPFRLPSLNEGLARLAQTGVSSIEEVLLHYQ